MSDFKTVKIFTQEWMPENLIVETYCNGDRIFKANNYDEWHSCGNQEIGCWCYYDFDSENGKNFGKLYNWYAVNDLRGLAPSGYRISNISDWEELNTQLGSDSLGEILMNPSGFALVLGGWLQPDNYEFNDLGSEGSFWTNNQFDPTYYDDDIEEDDDYCEKYMRHNVSFTKTDFSISYMSSNCGLSVRCLIADKEIEQTKEDDFEMNDLNPTKDPFDDFL